MAREQKDINYTVVDGYDHIIEERVIKQYD